MKKQLLENAINKPISLQLKLYKIERLVGYLVKDENNPKRYKILPLDINKKIIVFPASYVKEYVFLENSYWVK